MVRAPSLKTMCLLSAWVEDQGALEDSDCIRAIPYRIRIDGFLAGILQSGRGCDSVLHINSLLRP